MGKIKEIDIKEKILDVCERLFLQKGISETGVAEIAKNAKISKGTLYYHYENKDAIVDALATRYFERTEDAIKPFIEILINGVNVEEVINTCANVLKMKKTTEKMHYTLMAYGIISYFPLKERFVEKYKHWLDMIYEALEANQSNAYNQLIAHIILALIDGLAIENMLGLNTIDSQKDKVYDFIKLINID